MKIPKNEILIYEFKTNNLRKFVEVTDKKGTSIAEVDEDNSTMTRNVIRFICDIVPQETDEKTQEVTELVRNALNSKLEHPQNQG